MQQLHIRWRSDDELRARCRSHRLGPAGCPDCAERTLERDRVRSKLEQLRPVRRRMQRPRPDSAKLEAAGEDAIVNRVRPPMPGIAPRSWCNVVRIWYRSEGGEVLAVDSYPMTIRAAEKLKSDLVNSAAIATEIIIATYTGGSREEGGPRFEVRNASLTWPIDYTVSGKTFKRSEHEARLVRWPAEGFIRSDDDPVRFSVDNRNRNP